jgi:hypothetical protein
MKLTEKQLECMILGADKTLSFGCLVLPNDVEERERLDWIETVENFQEAIWRQPAEIETIEGNCYELNEFRIIWHPIRYWMLRYLAEINKVSLPWFDGIFEVYPELYKQTILDRPEELVDLVLQFLKSLDKNS